MERETYDADDADGEADRGGRKTEATGKREGKVLLVEWGARGREEEIPECLEGGDVDVGQGGSEEGEADVGGEDASVGEFLTPFGGGGSVAD